jgi:hypothetical protein
MILIRILERFSYLAILKSILTNTDEDIAVSLANELLYEWLQQPSMKDGTLLAIVICFLISGYFYLSLGIFYVKALQLCLRIDDMARSQQGFVRLASTQANALAKSSSRREWQTEVCPYMRSEFLVLLSKLVGQAVVLDDQGRKSIVDYAWMIASEHNVISSPDDVALRIRLVQLYGAFIHADQALFNTCSSRQTFEMFMNKMSEVVLDWFLNTNAIPFCNAKPLRLYRSVVAEVMHELPNLVILKEWPYDQVSAFNVALC